MALIPIKSVLVLVIIWYTTVHATQHHFRWNHENNETCTLPNNQIGRCLPFKECETRKQALNQTEVTLCGSDLLSSLVCCYVNKRKIGDMSKHMCKETYLGRIIPPEVASLIIAGGGYDAEAKEYPHMAALGYGDWENVTWACGGSLISDKIVMTAAHCIETSIGPLKYVRLGDVNLWRPSSNANRQDFTVFRTFIHPEFKPPSAYNDIALVELDRPYEPTSKGDFIAPACLQVETNIADTEWTATGWGETSHLGPTADHLQVVHLREASYDVCRNAFSNTRKRRLLRGIDHSSQMCAGHEKMDTCNGDSGGPLQVKNANYGTGYTVIGITSFGKACLLTKQPGVYTRVSHYIEWVESIVWPE